MRAFITFPVSTIPDREFGWLRKPNSVYFHTKEGRAINTFNSIGFNDNEISPIQSQNNSVLVLGDSFVEALQVPKAKNFTSLIENKTYCVDVFNAGRADLSPIHYYIVAQRLSKLLSPDTIILTINYGDFDDINRNDAKIIRDPNNGNIKNIVLQEKELSSLRIKIDDISSKSALVTFLGRRIKALKPPLNRAANLDDATVLSQEKKRENDDRVRDILRYQLETIRSIASLYILYIPKLEYQPQGKSIATKESEQFEQMIREIADKNKIPFLSIKKSMQEVYSQTNQPPIGFSNNNVLTGHLNEVGHQTVASKLVQLIDVQCVDQAQKN